MAQWRGCPPKRCWTVHIGGLCSHSKTHTTPELTLHVCFALAAGNEDRLPAKGILSKGSFRNHLVLPRLGCVKLANAACCLHPLAQVCDMDRVKVTGRQTSPHGRHGGHLHILVQPLHRRLACPHVQLVPRYPRAPLCRGGWWSSHHAWNNRWACTTRVTWHLGDWKDAAILIQHYYLY